MKNKFAVLAVALLFLAIIACGGTSPEPSFSQVPATLNSTETIATRETRITEGSEYFQTPDNWKTVPKTCYLNMVDLAFKNDHIGEIGSGSLISETKMVGSDGTTIYLYQVYSAQHILIYSDGTLLNKTDDLYHNKNKYVMAFLQSSQILDSVQNPVDIAVVSLISLNKITDFSESSVSNIVSGQYLQVGPEFFFSYSFPDPMYEAQYTISTVSDVGMENQHKTVNMRQMTPDSAVNSGSSGGAICNQNGQLVAVTKGAYGNSSDIFTIELNPENIQEQINSAINNSIQTMVSNGYSLQQ